MPGYLTKRELADQLRIGKRKVYDLASSGDVPRVQAMGKLLFPSAEITAWINASRSGPKVSEPPLSLIVADSHDPVLDWTLLESGSRLATYCDGFFDGLIRLADHSTQAVARYIHEGAGFNISNLRGKLGGAPVVLVEVARRQRDLLPAPGTTGINGFSDLKGRMIMRQDSAASQHLFETKLSACGLTLRDLPPVLLHAHQRRAGHRPA